MCFPLNSEIVCDRLRLCCEVMVNMCVCEPTLFKDDTDIATTVSLILEIFGKSEHLSATSVMAYVPDHGKDTCLALVMKIHANFFMHCTQPHTHTHTAPPSCPILKMNTLLLFILIANKTSEKLNNFDRYTLITSSPSNRSVWASTLINDPHTSLSLIRMQLLVEV